MMEECTTPVEERIPQTSEEMQVWVREQLEMEAVAAEVVRLDDARAMEKRLRKEIERLHHQLIHVMAVLRTLLLSASTRERVPAEILESGNGQLNEYQRQIILEWLESHELRVGLGLQLGGNAPKETTANAIVPVDCTKRLSECRAACCRLAFPLSLDEIKEGCLQWSLTTPFVRAVGPDGYCVHLDRETLQCTVYDHRSAICQNYSCQKDKRIWEDFEAGQLSPSLRRSLALAGGQKDPLDSGNKTGEEHCSEQEHLLGIPHSQ
jgi:Fe-S-cluster containining protein